MSRLNRIAGVCLAGALWAAPLLAHDPKEKAPAMDEKAMMEAFAKMAAVGENHTLLAGMAGEWTSVTKMWMAPGQPPQESPGTTVNTMIMGGRYLHSVHKSTVMGQPFEGIGTTAYDNLSGQFIGTWFDSMSTGIFVQTGKYDAATRTFTYRGQTQDPMSPATLVPVRSTLRLADADTHVFEWYETRDGHEARTMEIVYKRKK